MSKILICEKCKNPKCDGREYKIEGWSRTLCSSEVYKKNGKFYYHYVMGHGISEEREVFLIK